MSTYIARHRRPRLTWRQRLSSQLTPTPQHRTADVPAPGSLFTSPPVA